LARGWEYAAARQDSQHDFKRLHDGYHGVEELIGLARDALWSAAMEQESALTPTL
jgi:hypothetical protein